MMSNMLEWLASKMYFSFFRIVLRAKKGGHMTDQSHHLAGDGLFYLFDQRQLLFLFLHAAAGIGDIDRSIAEADAFIETLS